MTKVNRNSGAGDYNSNEQKLQEYNNLKKKRNLTAIEYTRMNQLEEKLVRKRIITPITGETTEEYKNRSPLQGISLYSVEEKPDINQLLKKLSNVTDSI